MEKETNGSCLHHCTRALGGAEGEDGKGGDEEAPEVGTGNEMDTHPIKRRIRSNKSKERQS